MGETRKLAAILVSDVVGYSRLAGADEDRILARLRTLRSDLIDPIIAVHHGRIVKRTGDGAIVEFRSVVEAVRCGVEVQNGMRERNAGVPDDQKIQFRLGIHVGDVVEESDGDLMGDGVNIAARLQSLAQPGAICVSEDAYRQVKQRLDLKVNDLGPTRLRNISEPIRVYSLELGRAGDSKAPTPAQAKSGPPHLSIVVLPFANLSGDLSQEYFVDGVTETLTTDLSRIRDSFVIARNTAFTYKGRSEDAKKVGRDLNVRYVLEGSVQRGKDRMRVNVQLIDATSGNHLWAERFDKPVADLFEMQDEIVAQLANSLSSQLMDAEAQRAERETVPDSLDLCFKAAAMYRKGGLNAPTLSKVLDIYAEALELDPNNVRALLGVAGAYVSRVTNYLYENDRSTELRLAHDAAKAAIGLAPYFAPAQIAMGMVEIYSDQAARGIARCQRALELDRNSTFAHTRIGIGKIFTGQSNETESHIREALRLSPRDSEASIWMMIVGHSKVHSQRFDDAIEWLTRSFEINQNHPLPNFYHAVALAYLGRVDEARRAVRIGRSLDPRFTIARFRAGAASSNAAYLSQREMIYEGMRRAGVPEG